MTNLNRELRNQVLESVIAATYIPAEKEAILASTSAAVRAYLMGCLPEGFLAATENLPAEWFGSERYESIHNGSNPVGILAGEDKGQSYVKFEPFRIPHGGYSPQTRYYQEKDSPHHWHKVLAAQIDVAKRLRAKEDALRAELNGFLYSVKTYKQVIEKMPELERHLPAPPVRVYPVAASTKPLQNALQKLGFDQGAKV